MYAAKNGEKDPRYKSKGGQTCPRSKLLAEAWLDSRRHARRGHHVLVEGNETKSTELAVAGLTCELRNQGDLV